MKKAIYWLNVLIISLVISTGLVSLAQITNNNTASALTSNEYAMYAQNDIMFYCNDGGNTNSNTRLNVLVSGNSDFSDILNAANAEKSYSDGEIEAPIWTDDDTEAMKRLLENYGDLAYRTGKAVGVPWVAILVQMRYEDAKSECGKNNFWGNGCHGANADPGTAKKQADTIGQAFVQYAETITNGYHNQALGISDPKEFLEVLGPTWVDGPFAINPEGYKNIEGMKKSIDALLDFINSPEGQEIVSKFGSGTYSGDPSGGSRKGSTTAHCGLGIDNNSSNNGDGIVNGDIAATAIGLAWPESEIGNHLKDPTDAYREALEQFGIKSDECATRGESCDMFVTIVMRASGADPDFVCCGVSNNGATSQYLKKAASEGKYQTVDVNDKQPGDILLSPTHIAIYVEIDGQPKIAEASHCERTGGISSYYDYGWTVYRLVK